LRIRAVAELTGVPEPTLRAWERRYGIPTPTRTPSGYRLFGPREIVAVREMRRLCDGGLAAAEAADVVRAQRADEDRVLPKEATPEPPRATADAYDAAVAALVAAVVRFDDEGLEETLRRVVFLGTPLVVLERVLRPTLRAIGAAWESGEISIAHEHLASHRIGSFMRESLRFSPGAHASARAILACFGEDEHELGVIAFAMQLSDWGIRPVILGARTPPSAIQAAVAGLSPRLVALSVTVPPPPAEGRKLCVGYGRACGDVPWIVGGAGSRAMAAPINAHGGLVAPDSLGELRELVGALLTRDPSARGGPAAK